MNNSTNKLNFVDDFIRQQKKEIKKSTNNSNSINNSNSNNSNSEYNFVKKIINKNTTIINKNFNNYIKNQDILFTRLFMNNTNEHKMCKISNDILDFIDNFILIIDFPNLGGGSTFFLNTIL